MFVSVDMWVSIAIQTNIDRQRSLPSAHTLAKGVFSLKRGK